MFQCSEINPHIIVKVVTTSLVAVVRQERTINKTTSFIDVSVLTVVTV